MKLLNLTYLNKFCKKHIFSIIIGLFTVLKKNNPSMIILYIVISLFGSKLIKNNCGRNISDNNSTDSSNACSNDSEKKWSSILKEKLAKSFFQNSNNNKNKNIDKVSDWLENNDSVNKTKGQEYKKYNNNRYNNDNDDNDDDNDDNYDDNNDDNDGDSNHNENIKIVIGKKKVKKQKIVNKIVNKNCNDSWHKTKINSLLESYNEENISDFKLTVTPENKNLLVFNLRTYSNIDFYFKLYITDYNNEKLNELIMLRDIQCWMTNSTITNDEFENICIPIYLILKDSKANDEIMIFEIYKMFFYEKEGIKQCFVSKGNHWVAVEEILGILFNFNYIKNLLNDKDYETYDLSVNNELCQFLDNLLSGCTLQNTENNEVVSFDMKENTDNKETLDYLYNTLNSETDVNMNQIDKLTTI